MYLSIYIYLCIYIRSICGQQLFRSLRAHQRSSDQVKILKDQSAQTTTRAVGLAYRLWLHFPINRVLNLTKLRNIISDQSVDSSCFALQHSSDQMKILKDQSAQTTTRSVDTAYHLWLPFSINRVQVELMA